MKKSLIDKHMVELMAHLQTNEHAFKKDYEIWISHYGQQLDTDYDFIQNQYQHLVEIMKGRYTDRSELYQNLRDVYLSLWAVAITAKKDAFDLKKQILYCDLIRADEIAWKSDIMFIANNCCGECGRLDGRKVSIRLALKQQPLPNPKCTRAQGCICGYGVKAIRDVSGRLIPRGK